MTAPNNKELEIVQFFSSVTIPSEFIKESKFDGLIRAIADDQENVKLDAEDLDKLRKEKNKGNFLSNWWHDRKNKIHNAHVNLNISIGNLTRSSSQLLILNTAISKVLNDQQCILLKQQNALKQQASELEGQNRKILEQQKQLEEQQRDINKANQGLLDAKGVTQEQAHKLVGCVVRVTEAEKKIDTANEALRSALEQHMNDSVALCISSMNDGFAKQAQGHDAFEQKVEQTLATQFRSTRDELEGFASNANEFKINVGQQLQAHEHTIMEKIYAQDAASQQLREILSAQLSKLQQDLIKTVEQEVQALHETVNDVEVQLAGLQIERRKSASRNRLLLATIACVALVSLGWQIAQHFRIM